MDTYERATTTLHCDSCDQAIEPGEWYARAQFGLHLHCGKCAIRSAAKELRAIVESLRDRVERVS